MSGRTRLVKPEKPAQGAVGTPARRAEDVRLITGHGSYVDDLNPANCRYLAVVRSAYAHAKLISIDTSKASAFPGVVAVATGEELTHEVRPNYNYLRPPEMKCVDTYPLAVGKVRFAGEPVVAIVATSIVAAKDAAELVEVDYEPLPVVVDAEEAIKPGAPLLYEEWGDNVMLHYEFGTGGVEEVFKRADVVLKERMSVHRHSPVPMETNCFLADYDMATGLTLWASTQTAHILRTVIVETLGIPEARVRVIEPDVGGGFGGKMPVHPEEILVSYFARRLGAPVKFVEERSEHLLASHQGREQTHYVEAAVKEDGTILAIRDRLIGNLGIFYPTCGPTSLMTASRFIPGCYKIQNYEVEVVGVTTNKAPYGAYRGYGKDAANYVIEKVMDAAARRLGIDPVELRLKNIIARDQFPYRAATGALYDSGDYAEALKKVCNLVGYNHFRAEQRELRKRGTYRGIAVSLVLEPAASHFPGSLLSGRDGSTARLEPTGRLTVLTGVTSTGTGTATAFAQIAADELGVSVDDVQVGQGDTSSSPFGYGMWASRGIVLGGNSVLLAVRKLREQILALAGALMNVGPDELRLSKGVVAHATDASKRMTLREVASAFYMGTKAIPAKILEKGLQETAYFMPSSLEMTSDGRGRRNAYATYGSSACAAVVEVDAETGMVKVLRYVYVADAGRIINPMLLTGQVQGGVIQGLGGTIYEENFYDSNGQPLASTFADYLMPTSLESPDVEVVHMETPSPVLPLGAKGAGEGPTEGAYALLSNAVEDALEPFGVKVRALPLSPERIWRLIREAKSK